MQLEKAENKKWAAEPIIFMVRLPAFTCCVVAGLVTAAYADTSETFTTFQYTATTIIGWSAFLTGVIGAAATGRSYFKWVMAKKGNRT